MKLLIKYPTRARPDQFRRVLALYVAKLSGKHDVRFVISADSDDATMNNDAVKAFVAAQPHATLCIGPPKTKIQACNADMAGRDFDVLVLASDDMIPVADEYDDVICGHMARFWPQLDGCLHYNDGLQGKLNTLSIMGRALYERFGYIYHPDYFSLWCDNEFQEVTEQWGVSVFINQVIIRHEWASIRDKLRNKGTSFYVRDGHVFQVRKAAGFPKGSVL